MSSLPKPSGVQVLGPGAVDKVTDIGVTAISLGATVDQLQGLDFAYAPPFLRNPSAFTRFSSAALTVKVAIVISF